MPGAPESLCLWEALNSQPHNLQERMAPSATLPHPTPPHPTPHISRALKEEH